MQKTVFCKAKHGILDTLSNPPQGRELDCYVLLCLLMYETLCSAGFAIRTCPYVYLMAVLFERIANPYINFRRIANPPKHITDCLTCSKT